MAITQDEAKERIAKLVARLDGLAPAERRAYTEGRGAEANTKKDFILPLFRCLGWDVDNAQTQEVFAEYDASNGAVDYAFRISGVSRYFVEAKPLGTELTEAKPIKQAIGYALHRGVTWAVLTDFKSLHIFYALGVASKLDILRWKTLSCTDYIKHFDDLWLLSRESIESGATDEEARRDGRLPPRLSIEQRLFGQFLQWREKLTNDLLRYHAGALTDAQVDEVIERLFNRLIFIRSCEDRQIEDRLLWQAWQEWLSKRRGGSLAASIRRIFGHFREWYDSDLFPQEPHLLDRPDLVQLDDDALEDIVRGLYTVPSGLADYDFKLIDADVLGAVYEQYLGHVARVARERAEQKARQLALFGTDQPHFEFVEKRAKRKQQGIYYTPRWVVDYIVRQTVGKALDEGGRGKGAAEERLFNIRILDPACGSGSFLIRAYDELIRRAAALSGRSEKHVFADERGIILKRSIFGVDLDPQAVDIARLNLMLRGLARRERLPELKRNVQDSNSLISGKESDLRPYFGDAWEAKKPFNWEQEFKDIMAKGGFDVVIGNPPYVRIQSLPREEADYFRDHYESAYGSFDIYVLFLEKAVKLLKPGGRLGFICSSKFLKSQYGKKIQGLLQRDCTVESIVDLSALKVFADATTYPAIVVLKKGANDGALRYVSVPETLEDSISAAELNKLPAVLSNQGSVSQGMWPPPPAQGDPLMDKLTAQSKSLGEIADRIFQGLITSADSVYMLERRGEPEGGVARVFSRATGKEYELEAGLLKPLLSGKHIKRYAISESKNLLLFPYLLNDGDAQLIPDSKFASQYPRCWAYLTENRRQLEDRERGKMRHEKWYAYVYPKNLTLHDKPKFAIPRLVHRLEAVYDREGRFYLDNVDVGGLILKDGSDRHYLYVLGLLNSRLMDFYFRKRSAPFRGGFRSANRQFIEPLPIRRIDSANQRDKKLHDDLVTLVEGMLELQQKLVPLRETPCVERDQVQHQIDLTDGEIDSLVYDLYGLTDAERKTVEDSFK